MRLPLIVAACVLILSCAAAAAEEPDSAVVEIDTNAAEAEEARGQREDKLADEIIAETRDCINVKRIRRTEIVNNRTLLFYMFGSTVYVNQLPHRCSGLRMADAFSYKITASRLCSLDFIRVVDTFTGGPRTACALGKFRPVTEEQAIMLREQGPAEQ